MPQVTPLTENFHLGGFLVSEARGKRSREIGIITAQDLLSGTVLGRRLVGAAGASAAFAANTGNGAMGAITVSGPAKYGVYRLVIIEPATNAGVFQVEDPDGKFVGRGSVAAAFSAGGLAFTLADGGTDFVAGDGFNITVTGGAYKYLAYDPTSVLGEQVAAAILWGAVGDKVFAAAADKQATIIVRSAEVNLNELVWGAGVTTAQHKTDAYLALALQQIIAR